jgi:hypothetical protein
MKLMFTNSLRSLVLLGLGVVVIGCGSPEAPIKKQPSAAQAPIAMTAIDIQTVDVEEKQADVQSDVTLQLSLGHIRQFV